MMNNQQNQQKNKEDQKKRIVSFNIYNLQVIHQPVVVYHLLIKITNCKKYNYLINNNNIYNNNNNLLSI